MPRIRLIKLRMCVTIIQSLQWGRGRGAGWSHPSVAPGADADPEQRLLLPGELGTPTVLLIISL